MLKTTKEFTAAMRSDTRKIHAKVEIDGVMYAEERIKTISGDLGILSGSSFLVGSTYSNSVKIVFDSILESVDYDQEVKVYLGIEVEHWEEPEEPIQYIPMGKFYIEDFYRNRNSFETTIESVDGFLYMEKPYESKLSYPAEMRKVALEICNQAGIEVDELNFSRLSNQKINKIEGATCREAIGYISQFHSGFAHFNRDGKFEIRNLLTTNYEITDSDYYLKGLEVKEKPYSTDGIQVKVRQRDNSEEIILSVGSTIGNVMELDNPIMTQPLLEVMWRQVSSISFIPFEMEWRGNPQLEAGDWITITDTEDRSFHVPILLMSFDYNGGLKMKSSAQTTSGSSSTYKYRGSINQVIKFLEEQIAANGVNRIFHGSATPTNAREGDIWFKPNGPYTEMWIYELDANNVLNWVLKVSTEPSEELIKLIENAQKETEKAIEDANNAREIAEDAVARADRSAQAAEDAKRVGEQAAANAKQAQETANLAVSDAEKALEDIENVDSRITTEINRVDGALSSKIEQTDFNKLEGTVINQGTQISQNATEIETKASRQEVNTISGKVDTHETRLTQNEKTIALKASQSSVDTLTGRVSSAETEISIVAGKYSLLNTAVEGHSIKIGALESNYDGLSSTVSVLQEDILGEVDILFSNISQRVDTIQLTVDNKADKSQITVLSNQISSVVQDVEGNKSSINIIKEDINLAVKKGDVINQINISPETILISGNKIRITGQTYIENAAIKSAAIASLDADRLTVGSTLNAASINVINLNASNLSSGYINANRIASKSITVDKLNATSLSAISANLGTITAGTLRSVTIQSGKFIGGIYEFDGLVTTNTLWMNGQQRTKAVVTKYGMFVVSDCFNIYDSTLEDVFMLQLVKHEIAVIHYSPYSNTTSYTRLGWNGYSIDSALKSGSYSGKPQYYDHAKSPSTVNPSDIK